MNPKIQQILTATGKGFKAVFRKLRQWRKPLLIGLCSLLLLFGIAYGLNTRNIHKLNSNPEFDPIESNLIARFKLGKSCTMRSVSGAPVNFDMGSRHSFISQDALDRISESGYPVKINRILLFTRDDNGRFHWYTRKATLDVQLPNPELPDSVYYIRNVELLVTDRPDGNVIGMDVLRHFVIEHIYETDEIRVYKSVPDDGYLPVCEVKMHCNSLGDLFGLYNRVSIELSVNDDAPCDYFFDTGGPMRELELVQPAANRRNATTDVVIDSLSGLAVQKDCRVRFGSRLRYSTVVYDDNLHTDDYSVNPLRLFDQDCVIDIPGCRLLIRKTKE